MEAETGCGWGKDKRVDADELLLRESLSRVEVILDNAENNRSDGEGISGAQLLFWVMLVTWDERASG